MHKVNKIIEHVPGSSLNFEFTSSRQSVKLTLSQNKNPHLFCGSTKCNRHSINDVICFGNTSDFIELRSTNPNCSSKELNQDVENVVKSFIPNIERLTLLRHVYTDSVIEEGLKMKTVKQLDLILSNLIEKVDKGEVAFGMARLFQTVGLKVEKTKNFSFTDVDCLFEMGKTKDEKIKKIMDMLRRGIRIVNLKPIKCFKYENHQFQIEEHTINSYYQSEYAEHVINLLLLLVTILKNPVKNSV